MLACSCSKHVGENIKCCKCDTYMMKYGKDSKMKQRYFCKKCKTTKVEFYTYKAYKQEINQNIVALTKEGVGILGSARLLAISPTTLLKRIKEIASNITQPAISKNKSYEIDEMRTFIGNKNSSSTSSLSRLIWIVYALEKESRKIVSFNVGTRTNKTLSKVIETVSLLNLRLRIHLKRLNSRSLAFSRCVVILLVALRICF